MITEIMKQYPHTSIIILGLAVAFFIQLVNYFILDKERLRDIKAKQKSLQEEVKQHRDNPQKMMELNQQMVSHSMEMMKHSFKPMLITFIPIIIFFKYMTDIFSTTYLGVKYFLFPVWLWYYLIASIIGSIIFRKLLKLP